MMPENAVIVEMVEQWQEDYITAKTENCEFKLSFHSSTVDMLPEQIKQQTSVLSTFIRSDCSAAELSNWPNLRLIATRSTGYDHIDLDYCEENGITVTNVPTYGDNTVAEHSFALILALSRKIHQVVVKTQRGEYNFNDIRGFDLRGKTLGVIGTGHIGKHVIKMARGFGMNVVAYDIHQESFIAELLGFDYVELDELLKCSQIISLHCPLTEATEHLLGARELELCSDDAIIVNTARGGLIDTEALLVQLKQGKLGGAALDVIEGEDLILEEPSIIDKDFPRKKLQQLLQNNQLLKMDNVIFTPHLAYNSREAVERILSTTVENIKQFLKGSPLNLITSS